jgi:hypothetical protein
MKSGKLKGWWAKLHPAVVIWLCMIGMFVLGFSGAMFVHGPASHPIEFTVDEVFPDKYSVEVRNTDDHEIHIKLAYFDDRDDTSGIITYVRTRNGKGARQTATTEDMYECQCSTNPAYSGPFWWRYFPEVTDAREAE